MSSAAYLHPAPPPHYLSSSNYSEESYRRAQCTGREQESGQRWDSSFRDGLPTPPLTNMATSVSGSYATSYGNGSYSSHHMPMYQASNLATAPHNASHHASRTHYSSVSGDRGPPSTAVSGHNSGYESKQNSGSAIASYLQIPASINSSQGSLSEFATEITCLFWFESGSTLRQVEDSNPSAWAAINLSTDTTPTVGFRKWVTTILSTTQVTQNVILLALLFIHRLKKFNPSVSGKRGSEFRLFTIALMLGNKFLDDNTYTNKTWAEVSGIAVQEIHIMEVEFLSNMRYNLFASEQEWAEWQQKLGKFYSFLQASSRASQLQSVRPSMPMNPASFGSFHKLPSPPSPTHVTSFGHHSSIASQHQHPLSQPPTLPPSPIRPVQNQGYPQTRKRSWDSAAEDRPAKRMVPFTDSYSNTLSHSRIPNTSASQVSMPNASTPPSAVPDHASQAHQGLRLPAPRLQTALPPSNSEGHPMHLPLPTGRAMSTVYPSQPATWSHTSTPSSAAPMMDLSSHAFPHFDSQAQHLPPTPARASPAASGYPVVTPTTRLSPSYLLTNRNSPYRPVRHVHTLLNPPPTTSLQNPSRNINFDHIRYQPLSKNPSQPRPGVVPYLFHDAWSQQMPIPSLSQRHPFA